MEKAAKTKVTFYPPKDLAREITRRAKKEDRSFSSYCSRVLKNHINDLEDPRA